MHQKECSGMSIFLVLSRCEFWNELLKAYIIEVSVPELVLNEMRQDETGHHFPNWQYQEKTTILGSCCSRKSGKNLEINGTRRDYSVPFGKVSSSTEFQDFSQKTTINNQDFS